jgi:uncharacterized protein (UPF0332 family)
MFDAARAALSKSGHALPKTHQGLITVFGERFAKTGILPPELGRDLNRAEELRTLADYMGQSVQMDHAEALVRSAHEFVQKIAKVFALEAENGDPDRALSR